MAFGHCGGGNPAALLAEATSPAKANAEASEVRDPEFASRAHSKARPRGPKAVQQDFPHATAPALRGSENYP
jgi:hypothetical protein